MTNMWRIVTRLQAEPASIMAEFLAAVRCFSLVSRPALGPTQPLFGGYQGSFSGTSWQGFGADYTSLYTCSTNSFSRSELWPITFIEKM